MSLVSKRLLSSRGRVQELWRTCFPSPRSDALSATTTIIGSCPVGAASMETFSVVVAGPRFASLSPQGRSFRALSSLPSSSDEHNKDKTTQVTSQVDKNFLRIICRGGQFFLPSDDSKSKGWDLRCLSPLKMTVVKSGMPALNRNSFDFLNRLQQGRADGPREFLMVVRYLNTAFLLPFMMIYNKISSIFLLNLSLLWHINHGMGEIMADYVHQQMTQNLMLVLLRLFLLIAMKDVFLSVVY